jgi:hypothetical protein
MNNYTFIYYGYNPELGIKDTIEIIIQASNLLEATRKYLVMVIDKKIYPETEPQLIKIGAVSVITSLN